MEEFLWVPINNSSSTSDPLMEDLPNAKIKYIQYHKFVSQKYIFLIQLKRPENYRLNLPIVAAKEQFILKQSYKGNFLHFPGRTQHQHRYFCY